MQTVPPPANKFSVTVNQWVIYDSYVEYEYQKELQDEQERLAKLCDPKRAMKKFSSDKQFEEEQKNDIEEKFLRAARVLERMVVQSIHCDIALGIGILYNVLLHIIDFKISLVKYLICFSFYRF